MEVLEIKKEFTVKHKDITLIDAKIRLPVVTGKNPDTRRINKYYRELFAHLERYVNGKLAKQARKQYEMLTNQGFIFHSYAFYIDFTVTLNEAHTLSLYIDRGEYTGGANGTTVRSGDTWEHGFPLQIKALSANKRKVQRQIMSAIQQRQANGEVYFEPVPRYVKKYYKPEQFYLTPEGVTLFYQETTIAPHASSIITFQGIDLV